MLGVLLTSSPKERRYDGQKGLYQGNGGSSGAARYGPIGVVANRGIQAGWARDPHHRLRSRIRLDHNQQRRLPDRTDRYAGPPDTPNVLLAFNHSPRRCGTGLGVAIVGSVAWWHTTDTVHGNA